MKSVLDVTKTVVFAWVLVVLYWGLGTQPLLPSAGHVHGNTSVL